MLKIAPDIEGKLSNTHTNGHVDDVSIKLASMGIELGEGPNSINLQDIAELVGTTPVDSEDELWARLELLAWG